MPVYTSTATALIMLALSLASGCADAAEDELGSAAEEPLGLQNAQPTVVIGRDLLNEGSGCPPGSVTPVLTVDSEIHRIVSISFLSFKVESLATTPVRKSMVCYLLIPLVSRPDISMALTDVRFEGVASLAPGVTATVVTNGTFNPYGMQDHTRLTKQLAGQLDGIGEPRGTFLVSHTPPKPIFRDCGSTNYLQLFIEVQLDPTTAAATKRNSWVEIIRQSTTTAPQPAVKADFALKPCTL